jgi:uncharacterized protein DUF4124
MRQLLLALILALAPALVHADDVYRWQDENGVLHYSNVADLVPAGADVVTTPITLEVARMPSAAEPPARTAPPADERRPAFEGYAPPGYRFRALPDAPRVYDEGRLMFGCFTAGTLYYGGFAHADDISPVQNCLPYRLGPEAWLNAARAELAMRQSGINPRDMLRLYTEGPYEVRQPRVEKVPR